MPQVNDESRQLILGVRLERSDLQLLANRAILRCHAPCLLRCLAARLLFSAKESVHKCIEPLTGEMLDFLDVEVAVDVAEQTFGVRPKSESARAIAALGELGARVWSRRPA